jgi:hypothetical protein
LTTGKSTTDHVISAARDQDCAMHRIAFGDDMCRQYASESDKPITVYDARFPGDADDWRQHAGPVPLDDQDGGPAVNTAEVPLDLIKEKTIDPWLVSSLAAPISVSPRVSMDFSGVQAAAIDTSVVARTPSWSQTISAVAVEYAVLPPLPKERPSVAARGDRHRAAASVPSVQGVGRFLALGSFRAAARANRLLERFAHLQPKILTVDIAGKEWNRVSVGPLSASKIQRLHQRYARIDGKDTWAFVR